MVKVNGVVKGKQAKPLRRRQPEQVRERVLSAALSVFASMSFDGATLQQIADKASVSLPLIVYHFKSKEKLWQAVIEDAVNQFDLLLEQALSNDSTLPATAQLKDVIDAFVRVSVTFPEFRRILANEAYMLTPRLKWIGENFAKRHHATIIGVIQRAQEEGTVLMIEPHNLSYLIVAMATKTSFAAEYEYLSGLNPFDVAEIDANIAAINRIVFIDG